MGTRSVGLVGGTVSVAIFVAIGAFISPASAAGAYGVAVSHALACGATVTASVQLRQDLLNCPGDGLVVGAAGITIDLNGHTISGSNALGGEGIADDGHGEVVIEGGVIRGFFENGVGLRSAPNSMVRGLVIRDIGAGGGNGQFSAGIVLESAPGSRLTRNSISNDVTSFESDGVVVKTSPNVRVDHNQLNRNSWDGLILFASPRSQVETNVADQNVNNGMEINGASDGTQLLDNETSRNGNVGIAAGAMNHAVIAGNVANGNGHGMPAEDTGLFFFDLNNSEIAGNTAAGNVVGIDLFGGLNGSTHNDVVGNTTNNNDIIGLVIDAGDGGTLTNGANDNVVTGNVAKYNRGSIVDGAAGIGVFGTGNLLRRNTANRNTADGFLIGSAGNTLAVNTANANGGHGISAVSGTVDAGGNHGRHNSLSPQCIGVACA